jgi:hypothetical protein
MLLKVESDGTAVLTEQIERGVVQNGFCSHSNLIIFYRVDLLSISLSHAHPWVVDCACATVSICLSPQRAKNSPIVGDIDLEGSQFDK